jgi:phospholipid/cholesterol/gamma-HCH transport system substrate-binding protein
MKKHIMSRRKNKSALRLGIFVTIGTLLFIIGIYIIGEKRHLFNRTFRISCVTDNVSGLLPGGNVRFSGINVGTVENIVIVRDTVVRIDMIIQEDVQQFIRRDSRAIVGSEGLMGNKLVNILPGSMKSGTIRDGDMILSEEPMDVDEIMGSLQRTGRNIEHITGDLAYIMHNVSHGKGTMGKILTDSAFAETLHQALINVEQGTQGFSQNMEALKGNVLFRGYYKKKDKERRKEEEQEEEDKKRDRKKKDDK